MEIPLASWILFGAALIGVASLSAELFCLYLFFWRKPPQAKAFPPFSILKPLCGQDDELWENLESHLSLDYPGEYEILLGVREEEDLAYPIARDFAAAHPEKVRLVIQEGEPGHNPKVNQLITLTRAARFQHLAMTDSNVRVPPSYLREHAALLERPEIGLTSNLFVGAGEQRLGAILDNLLLAGMVAPNLASGHLAFKLDQVVGKSLGMRREVLEQLGGWHAFKDFLAEDNRLARALVKAGLKTWLCSSPVLNVQRSQPLSYFVGRQARWVLIRSRVVIGVLLLEPLLYPFNFALAGAAVAFDSPGAWAFAGAVALFNMAHVQLAVRRCRGYGFRLRHLLLLPLRDLLFYAAWLKGLTSRSVVWRGNLLRVMAKTRLAAPVALARVKNIQRLGNESAALRRKSGP